MIKRYFYILTFLIGLFLVSNLNAQIYRDSTDCSDQLSLAWVKTAGANDVDAVNDIVSDESGNIYITGFFSYDMDFQGTVVNSVGYKDFYVAKLDNDGNLLWIQTGGGTADDEGVGIDLDGSGNVYVTGNYGAAGTFGTDDAVSYGNKDIFLLKYDNSGNYQWGNFFGGFDDDIAGDVCVDNNNYPAITGTYYFAMYLGGSSHVSVGLDDFFVAKFNSSGDFQWMTAEGSSADDSGLEITCDAANNFYVAGEFSGNIDFGPQDFTASGTNDIFMAKYSSSGSFSWAIQAGTGGDNDKLGDIAYSSSDDKVYLAYKNDQVADQGKIDIYNTTGIYSNGIVFGGSGTVQPYGLTVDYSGAAYVSGMYSGSPDFGDGNVVTVGGSDYFVAKYNSDGSFGFKDVAGSIYLDCGAGVALDNSNNLFVAGYCNNGIYFGGTPYAAQGKEDILITKYDSYFAFEQIEISSINCDPNNMCVDIEIAGGLPPFDYYWEGGETTEDVCGYSSGEYQIIVTDDNDCYIATTVTITAPTADPIDLAASYNMCFHDTLTLDAGDYVLFDWSPNEEETQTIDIYDPGLYSVTVTDENSCTTSASTTVNESADINMLVSDTVHICSEESIAFTVPGFTDYMWSNGSIASTYTTSQEGYHWLWAYDGSCYYFDTVFIENYPKDDVSIGEDAFVCEGDSVLIDAAADAFASYLWQDNSTESYFWAFETGNVSVMATDTNGCVTSDELLVTLMAAEIIELGENATYCAADPILLDPQDQGADNTYLWSTGQTSATITVDETNQYWVNVTNPAGCVTSDTITLTIYEQPILELGEDISFCEGGSDTIWVIGDYITYEWNVDETSDYIYVDSSGFFSVTATDVNGCSATDYIIVYESDLEEPFLGYDTVLCNNEIYRLEPQEDYYRYQWQNGTMGPYISVSQPGAYALTVTDQVGCTASSSINIDYTTGPTILSIDSGGGQIIVGVTGGTTPYQFSYDGDTWQTEHYFTMLSSGLYTVYVMDANYCMVSLETFLDETIDVPAFFTPNGDGYNDYWVIQGLYQFPDAKVQIFDRYGKKLYEFTGGTEFVWDGNYVGRPLPSDTYWYSIKLEKNRKPFTGHVTIKR